MHEYVVVDAGVALHGLGCADQKDPSLSTAISDVARDNKAIPAVITRACQNNHSFAVVVPHKLLSGSHNG